MEENANVVLPNAAIVAMATCEQHAMVLLTGVECFWDTESLRDWAEDEYGTSVEEALQETVKDPYWSWIGRGLDLIRDFRMGKRKWNPENWRDITTFYRFYAAVQGRYFKVVRKM